MRKSSLQKDPILWMSFCVVLLSVGLVLLGKPNQQVSLPTDQGSDLPAPVFRVGVHIWNQTAWSKLKPVMQAGDFVLVSGVSLGQAVARDKPGLNVVYATRETDSVRTMAAHLKANPLPREIQYVRYDFEPEYQPEFTWILSDALPNFAQARDICAQFNESVSCSGQPLSA